MTVTNPTFLAKKAAGKIHRTNYKDTTTERDVSSCGVDIKENGTNDNHEVTCKRCLNAWW